MVKDAITPPPDHDSPTSGRPIVRVIGGELPRSTGADAARTIFDGATTGMLSTHSTASPGYPFGSIVSPVADDDGNPLFVISTVAEHTHNLRADARTSLLITEPAPADGGDRLAAGRLTLLGTAEPVPADEQDAATDVVTAKLPAVGAYAGYGDFSCWRLTVESIRWVGGFGRMDWIELDAYRTATVDPVIARRAGVIEHMNADHADAGVLLCQRAIGDDLTVTSASFDYVDRFGCDYVATTTGPDGSGVVPVRLAFDHVVDTVDGVRAAVVALVRSARSAPADDQRPAP